MGPFVAIGEALWDLLPGGAVLGGAPLNYAYRVSELGYDARMISRVGNDELGDRAVERMTALGLSSALIQRDPERPTGSVEVSFDEERNPSYYIVPGVAYDAIAPAEAALEAAGRAACVCYGTLAQREEVSRDTIRTLVATARSGERLYDVNLRPGSVYPETIRRSLEAATIVKLNDEEAATLNEMFSLQAPDLSVFSARLMEEFPVSTVVVTIGDRGAYLRTGADERYRPSYAVTVDDPCGSGDAFTAALSVGLIAGDPIEEVLDRAAAYGAAVATQRGATETVSSEMLETIIQTGRRGRRLTVPISLGKKGVN